MFGTHFCTIIYYVYSGRSCRVHVVGLTYIYAAYFRLSWTRHQQQLLFGMIFFVRLCPQFRGACQKCHVACVIQFELSETYVFVYKLYIVCICISLNVVCIRCDTNKYSVFRCGPSIYLGNSISVIHCGWAPVVHV